MFLGTLYLKIFKGTIHSLSTNDQIPLGIWYINICYCGCANPLKEVLSKVCKYIYIAPFFTLLKQQLPFPDVWSHFEDISLLSLHVLLRLLKELFKGLTPPYLLCHYCDELSHHPSELCLLLLACCTVFGCYNPSARWFATPMLLVLTDN